MNFYSAYNCDLIAYREEGRVIHYDIMSGQECIGSIRFCPLLREWIVRLSSNVGITYDFMVKVWGCLLIELSA